MLRELRVDRRVVGGEVGRHPVDEMHERRGPLAVPQELEPEAPPQVRILDKAGHVEHDSPPLADLHNAEHWLQRRERVVRDLRLRAGDDAQQRRLPRVRRADERSVRQQLHFEEHAPLLAGLAAYGEERLLVRRRCEARVALAALPRVCDHGLRAVLRQFREQRPLAVCSNLPHDRPDRNVHPCRLALAPRAILAAAGSAVSPTDARHPFEMVERPDVAERADEHGAAVPPVSPVGPSPRAELLPEERHRPVSPTASDERQFCCIQHIFPLCMKDKGDNSNKGVLAVVEYSVENTCFRCI